MKPNIRTAQLSMFKSCFLLVAAACCGLASLTVSAHDDADYQPDVNVLVAPQLEHWPSNYVPDGYSLDSYDGEPDRPTVCRGTSGYTLSTSGHACPAGQDRAQAGQTWSTTTFD